MRNDGNEATTAGRPRHEREGAAPHPWDDGPFTRPQVRIVLLCIAINTVDGFDILIMGLAAPELAREWHLTGAQTGLLLSSALVGMAVGSVLAGPLADRLGRRPLTIACLALSTAGMAAATLSTGPGLMAVSRVVTGIGVGGLVAVLPVIVTEYVPARLRTSVVTLYSVGNPLGGVLGATAAVVLMQVYGWRATFAVGAVLTFVLLLVVVADMPESLDFLVTRRPRGALQRANALLGRLGRPALDVLPEVAAAPSIPAAILGRGNRTRSGIVWTLFFLAMATYFFASSWTPRLLQQSGLSLAESLRGGLLLAVGGVVGILLAAAVGLRLGARRIAVLALAGTAVALVGTAATVGASLPTLMMIFVLGMFASGTIAGLFTLTPLLYPPTARGTAVGSAAAFGRLGAIVAPALTGVLVDLSWAPGQLFVLFALPMAVAAVVSTCLRVPTSVRRAAVPTAVPHHPSASSTETSNPERT